MDCHWPAMRSLALAAGYPGSAVPIRQSGHTLSSHCHRISVWASARFYGDRFEEVNLFARQRYCSRWSRRQLPRRRLRLPSRHRGSRRPLVVQHTLSPACSFLTPTFASASPRVYLITSPTPICLIHNSCTDRHQRRGTSRLATSSLSLLGAVW